MPLGQGPKSVVCLYLEVVDKAHHPDAHSQMMVTKPSEFHAENVLFRWLRDIWRIMVSFARGREDYLGKCAG